jgi:hypothetical protein
MLVRIILLLQRSSSMVLRVALLLQDIKAL